MNKIVMLFVLFTSLVFYYFYNKKEKSCDGSPDGINYPKVFRAQRSEAIKLQFDMLRAPDVGCMARKASEFYSKVGCGYKLVNSDNWVLMKPVKSIDNEMKYSVVCEIPALGEEAKEASTVEFYFEYSAWGRELQRETQVVILQ